MRSVTRLNLSGCELVSRTRFVALRFANAHNLELALEGVAQRMNVDEDVLFLFLTSHGSRAHVLSVDFWPIELNSLPAVKLKEMLDRSGIRNRVIVVSPCYSGGFLDVLKDDHSLIMTAASRDKTSFGCGDTSEFTYFGEAYFVKALNRHTSFILAFDEARLTIEKREAVAGLTPSAPQIHIGARITQILQPLASSQSLMEVRADPPNAKH